MTRFIKMSWLIMHLVPVMLIGTQGQTTYLTTRRRTTIYAVVNTGFTTNRATVLPRASGLIDVTTCGEGKSCFRSPPNCNPTSECDAVTTWRVDNNNNQVYFEMGRRFTPGNSEYIALGLSYDQVMGFDSVMECVLENGRIKARLSKNDVHANVVLAESTTNAVMSNVDLRFYNGYMVCKFQRTREVAANLQNDVFPIYQNNAYQTYYTMVAWGNVALDATTNTYRKQKHIDKYVSSTRVSLNTPVNYMYSKAHQLKPAGKLVCGVLGAIIIHFWI